MQFLFYQIKKKTVLLSLAAVFIFGIQAFAIKIKKNINLEWVSPRTNIEGQTQTKFLGAVYERGQNLVPIYADRIGKCGTKIINSKITVLSLENEIIHNNHLDDIKITEVKAEFSIGFERGQAYLFVKVLPYIKAGNTLQRIVSFTIEVETNDEMELPKAFSKAGFAANSVLAQGNWYRIATMNNAVHRIDYTFLKSMGINVDGIDPRNIKIYGNGAGMLPEQNAVFRYDDLQENAILVQGESDGKFNQGDFILFYGQDQKDVWSFNKNTGAFIAKPNLYCDTTYFYLTIANGVGKRITSIPSALNPSYTTTTYDVNQHHEEDLVNFVKTGRNWYGEEFNKEPVRSFTNIINDIDTSTAITFTSSVAGRSSQGQTFDVQINNEFILSQSCAGIPLRYDGVYADLSSKQATFKTTSGRLDINYTYNGSVAQGATGWLDYYTVNARANLKNTGKQVVFTDKNAIAPNAVALYKINSSRNLTIWDVSNPTQVFAIQGNFDVNNLEFSFSAEADSLRKFIAFDGGNYVQPAYIGKVRNQNIHGLSAAQGVIITHEKFMNEAQRLADYHTQKNGFKIHVINVADIYTEFGSGAQDITAIRDMLRMFYKKYTAESERLKYVTLFGRASYDYKNNWAKTKTGYVNTNYIPTYEEFNSTDPGAYCTDDYFVCLDDNEGNFLINPGAGDLLDIGIGRMPVQETDQAKAVVDKVIYYQTKSSFGDWRNRLTFVADDEFDDNNLINFLTVCETLSTTYIKPIKKFNIEKIYTNSFEPTRTAGGKRFPQVNTAITNAVNKGSLVLNYVGHGGEVGWSARRILSVDEINSWNVKENMPLLMTATCEFSRFDDPLRLAAGELALVNPNGGPISLFTTVRLVYAGWGANDGLNAVFNSKIGLDSNAILNPKTFGDLMMQTKNNFANFYNTRNFTLLGDPMLQLALPKYVVKTNTVNGKLIETFTDTVKALSKVTITGQVLDQNNNLMSSFNGVVYPTVFDKESTYPIIDNDPDKSVKLFNLQNNIIYKGAATVSNGKFTFSFIVPKDISYQYGFGKISYYANNDTTDASGYEGKVLIGGTYDTAWSDNVGPKIQLYMNDEKFVNGGTVPQNALFIAKIYDENGINTTSRGVGRDLNAIMNKDNSNTIIMNDFYRAELNTYQNGVVNYSYKNLPIGQNKIKFQAYDIFNNVGEAEIEFVVASDNKLTLANVLNYPNPFTTNTAFHFDHNKAGQDMQVLIQIFTVSGKLIKSMQRDIIAATSHFSDISWDGRDDFGDPIGKGVYIYKVKVKAQGKTEEAYQKLVILN
ncbi:MAG: type IX secretion system sortase PorU [Bacteroidota bacterium]